MKTILRVRLDLNRIAQRLARLHGQRYSSAAVRRWLRIQGFRADGDAWRCDGNGVGGLQSDEILAIATDAFPGSGSIHPSPGAEGVIRLPLRPMPDLSLPAG